LAVGGNSSGKIVGKLELPPIKLGQKVMKKTHSSLLVTLPFISLLLIFLASLSILDMYADSADALFKFEAEMPPEIRVNQLVPMKARIGFVIPEPIRNVSVQIVTPPHVKVQRGSQFWSGDLEKNEVIELQNSFQFTRRGEHRIQYLMIVKTPRGKISEPRYLMIKVYE
jgi:hypothetical protein